MPPKHAKDTYPRRSARLTVYDSNGRDALASTLNWSRTQLETWLTSPTVRPHLRLWYRTCIENERRYNEGIEWINTGEKGYYYNPSDLEEDVLLECFGEGIAGGSPELEAMIGGTVGFATEGIKTASWTTVELWARTAWRIVQNNMDAGQVFEQAALKHPAACYAAVIDLLCIAFHSIAHRGAASCYRDLIIGGTDKEKLAWSQGREIWVKEHGWEDQLKIEAGVESDEEDGESDGSSDDCSYMNMSYGSSDKQASVTAHEDSKTSNSESDESCIAVAMSATLAALKEEKEHAAKLQVEEQEGDKRKVVEKWLGLESHDSDSGHEAMQTDAPSIICTSEAPTVILSKAETAQTSGEEVDVMQDVQLATPESKQSDWAERKGKAKVKVAMLTPQSQS